MNWSCDVVAGVVEDRAPPQDPWVRRGGVGGRAGLVVVVAAVVVVVGRFGRRVVECPL